MNRARILKLEEKMKPVAPLYRVAVDGWRLVGGGPGASGVLRVPPRLTVEEWEMTDNQGEL